MALVYIQEKDDGGYYIGMADNPRKDYRGGGLHFKRSYRKDPSRWAMSTVADGLTLEQASWLEAALVGQDTIEDKLNYNILLGGYNNRKHTAETRKKMSDKLKGRKAWNKGIKAGPDKGRPRRKVKVTAKESGQSTTFDTVTEARSEFPGVMRILNGERAGRLYTAEYVGG